jgi:hypothetical protein
MFKKIAGFCVVMASSIFSIHIFAPECPSCTITCACQKPDGSVVKVNGSYDRYYKGTKGCQPKNCENRIYQRSPCFSSVDAAFKCMDQPAQLDAARCIESMSNRCYFVCKEQNMKRVEKSLPELDCSSM